MAQSILTPEEAEQIISLLIAVRAELRVLSQYCLADWIRMRLLELGIILEDEARGTQWHHRMIDEKKAQISGRLSEPAMAGRKECQRRFGSSGGSASGDGSGSGDS